MHYMLLLYGDPAADPPPATPPGVIERWEDVTAALRSDGSLLAGDGLRGPETATTVRFRAGAEILTDGPFVESKEGLLGYYLLDLPDLDAALEWARRMPNLGWGAVEVRPLNVGPASGPLTRGE